MKTLSFRIAALVALTAATAPALADHKTNETLRLQLLTAINANDVVRARTLIASPNFSPLLSYGTDTYTVFEMALRANRPTIARAMMNSTAWKKIKWNRSKSAQSLVEAAYFPALFPVLKDLARLPGSDLNTPGARYGATPLGAAAVSDNLSALKWLAVQPNINLNARNNEGHNALFDAGTPATKFLVTLPKMDVNARDSRGWTALHEAVETGKVTKVRALLASPRIDPNLRDKDKGHRTPLDLALSENQSELAAALMASKKVRTSSAQRALMKRFGQWTPEGDRMGP